MSYASLAESVDSLNQTNKTLVDAVLQFQSTVQVPSYAALRQYWGIATVLGVTNNGIAGTFDRRAKLPTDVDDGGVTIVSTAGPWTYVRRGAIKRVLVEWFGAVADGATESDEPFNRAAASLSAMGGGLFEMSAGDYLFANSAGRNFRFFGNVRIAGQGMGVTRIIKHPSNSSGSPLIHNESIDPATDYIELCGFSVEDRWGKLNYTDLTNNTVFAHNATNFKVHDVAINGSGAGSIVTNGCKHVQANNNRLSHGKRDGIRAIGFETYKVFANRFENILDDAVAGHTPNSVTLPESYVTVMGNTLVECQGITCLGAKTSNILGNTLIRPMVRGIRAGADSAASEGNTALLSTNIIDNTIVDLMNGAVFGWANLAEGIYVNCVQPQTKDNVEQAAAGVVIRPYDHFYTNDTLVSGKPNAGSYNLTIRGNKVIRTLKPAAKYSDYGFGPRLSHTGWIDPAITAADFCNYAVRTEGPLRNTQIEGNTLNGARYGLYVFGGTGVTWPTIRDYLISNNIISNMSAGGVLLNGNGWVDMCNNTFDLDPFLEHSGRNADGSWSSLTALSAIVRQNSGISASIVDCTFKNMSSPADSIPAYRFTNSKIHIDPVSDGAGGIIWKGMNPNGNVRQIDATTVVIEDSDPTSATFRNRKSVCPRYAGALPTSGAYPAGYFLENFTTTSTTRGWKRITTGEGHVLGVDWTAV